MRTFTLAAFVAAMLLVAGCAGRAPQPVALIQPQDQAMDCNAISMEAWSNNNRVAALSSEQGGKVAQNVAAGVVGLFIWPVWFAMDFQGTASTETTALQARQQYLTAMAQQRRCGAPAVQAAQR